MPLNSSSCNFFITQKLPPTFRFYHIETSSISGSSSKPISCRAPKFCCDCNSWSSVLLDELESITRPSDFSKDTLTSSTSVVGSNPSIILSTTGYSFFYAEVKILVVILSQVWSIILRYSRTVSFVWSVTPKRALKHQTTCWSMDFRTVVVLGGS